MDRQLDLVSVIEAAYTPGGERDEWLRRLGEAAAPSLDRGMGLLAYTFDASDVHQVVCSETVPIGSATEELAQVSKLMNQQVPSELLAHILLSLASFGTASELSGKDADFIDDPQYRQHAHRLGLYDFLGIIGLNPPGTGVVLGAPLSAITSTTPEERALWARVATHMAAALRLRELSEFQQLDPLNAAEAIIAPDGRIAHAEGQAAEKSAQQELSEAVRNIEEAKGPLRRKAPEEALERWPSLLRRRWTVHETEDTDGKRFLVARVNVPRPERLSKLPLPQRQVAFYRARFHSPELIAYELGMHVDEVERHLENLARELEVDDVEELPGFLNALLFGSFDG